VNKEIDDGEREAAQQRLSRPPVEAFAPKVAVKAKPRDDRALRKEVSSIEKTIARLDGQKKETQAQLMATSDPKEALRLHEAVEALAKQLAEAEERWCALQEELGEM
jgi:ATP-binding cassette subfamily F protein 3